MRAQFFLSLFIISVPIVCMASPATMETIVLKKGAYIYEQCDNSQSCQCGVDISYPKFSGIKNAELLNSFVKNEANKAVSNEENTFACSGTPIDDVENGATEYGFSANPHFENDDLLLVSYGTGYYGAGAAHPNSDSETIMFDKRAGKILTNADIFKVNKLEALNNYILKQLENNDDWYEPWDEEYRNVVSVRDVKGDIYIKGNRLRIDVHPSYPIYIYVEIPSEFINHQAIRKLYKEPVTAIK